MQVPGEANSSESARIILCFPHFFCQMAEQFVITLLCSTSGKWTYNLGQQLRMLQIQLSLIICLYSGTIFGGTAV